MATENIFTKYEKLNRAEVIVNILMSKYITNHIQIMLLEKLLKEFNFSTNIFNWEEFKLFDQYFERILVSKGTFLIKEGETERYSYFVFDGILRC